MRIDKDQITIRVIEESDMLFIQKLWADKEAMISAGGVYHVTDEMFSQLFEVLNNNDNFNNHYIILVDDQPIGDLSIREYTEVDKVTHLDFKLDHTKWQKGYGKKVLDLILDYYFNELSGEALYFELWLTNYFAFDKLKEYGFEATSEMEDATIMTLTKEKYKEVYNV